MNENDKLPILELEEIRSFFARRPYYRPSDYDEILTISKPRQKELSIYICGYEAAKYGSNYTPNP